MELVFYPDKRLKIKCEPVEEITPELKQLARNMYQYMIKCGGIGLAANQVNKTFRLIVVEGEKPFYMFNPVIIQGSRSQYKLEGCLSFPNETKRCRRHQKIVVRYKNMAGNEVTGHFHGLLARCVQHEIDHLNGITFDEREKKDDS